MRPNARKNIIYSIILLIIVFMVYLYRQNQKPQETVEVVPDTKISFSGSTMGTSYNVVYLDEKRRNFKSSVDSLLVELNKSLSTYIPNSEISRFNQQDSLVYASPFFFPVLEKSRDIYQWSEGAFDPTVGPLVNLWGFGPEGPEKKEDASVYERLRLVGFDQLEFDQKVVRKNRQGLYLDFSAIAKGYGVDLVAEFLKQKGIANMLVEIGGELVGRGVNDKGEIWKVGINQPDEGALRNDLYAILALDNKGMATSGNYRNFYEKDGKKYSHTIDPATGYPVQHELLSATVLAKDCMTADAIATAVMVMGKEKAIQLREKNPDFDLFLIYTGESGDLEFYANEEIKPYLSNLPSPNQ
ncbi:FAD:protein FMN transferase [Pararhodonellum marinum]|uniref:FAD:protein FMN transferase n=1 Tax=Pararhodonellum marinum TaxID=2755358 RepID=UPI00188F9513|nr:FAD:protein FMN transferase [Pararhodonellum marinum]